MNIKVKAGLIIFAVLLIVWTVCGLLWQQNDTLTNLSLVAVGYIVSKISISVTKKRYGLTKEVCHAK